MSPAAAAEIVGADRRGEGSWTWFTRAPCPVCRNERSVAIHRLGWLCRNELCKKRGRDLETYVARVLAIAGRSAEQIRAALNGRAA